MTRSVRLTKTAQLGLNQLLDYLEHEWSDKVKQEFIREL